MDRGAWRATVYRVAKSQTRLSNFHLRAKSQSPGLIPGHEAQIPQVARCSQKIKTLALKMKKRKCSDRKKKIRKLSQ